jgi:hypothetical protein
MDDRLRRDCPANRGQTTHDFAIGISVFLLATVFVITFVTSMTTPYSSGITETEQEYAQSAARQLMTNFTTESDPTALNATKTTDFFTRTWGPHGLERRLGLPDTSSVNVVLREPGDDGAVGYETGATYRSQTAATAVRLGQLNGKAVRLEVRVW